MLCRQCGTQIRKQDKRPDGLYKCPGCGKLYRVKGAAKPDGQTARQSPAKKRCALGLKLRPSPLLIGIAAALIVAIALIATLASSGGREDTKAASSGATATVDAAMMEQTPTPTVAPTATPEPIEAASVHFRAVGDIMSHKLQLTHALQKDGSYNYDSQFAGVKEALSKADFTIANLELSIATNKEYSSYPFFRTPEAILATLKDCGIDMFTMANNHILDGFWDGLTHTIDKVDEYGFAHVGAYRTAEEARQPLVMDINGIKFGFLAYTLDVNDNDKRIDPDKAKFCVNILGKADFKADVQALRDQGAEVVICLPHWGEEGRRSVAGSCKKYAQQMVDAGVDIILGSHPHVVLPINLGQMEVNGEQKDILIAWSMGNFISYMATQYMDSGIIVDFTVTRDEEGKISIHDVGYVPVYVVGNPRQFHLVCSGDFYSEQPDGMSDGDYKRMKQSVREIAAMIDEEGIEALQN